MHSEEEIILGGRNGIGNLPPEKLTKEKIRVPIELHDDKNDVINAYDVYFNKIIVDDRTEWDYTGFVPYTIKL